MEIENPIGHSLCSAHVWIQVQSEPEHTYECIWFPSASFISGNTLVLMFWKKSFSWFYFLIFFPYISVFSPNSGKYGSRTTFIPKHENKSISRYKASTREPYAIMSMFRFRLNLESSMYWAWRETCFLKECKNYMKNKISFLYIR